MMAVVLPMLNDFMEFEEDDIFGMIMAMIAVALLGAIVFVVIEPAFVKMASFLATLRSIELTRMIKYKYNGKVY